MSHPFLRWRIWSTCRPEGNQLVFDMARPAATLPDGLTVPLDKGPDLVGTGPYHVVSQQDSMAVLEAFDRYYKGKPTIDRVVVKAFDALRPTWASLLRGELNVVYDVPVDAVEFVRNEEIDVVSVPRWYQHHVTLNLRDGRFKSPLVRKALNLAVDRVAIVQKVPWSRHSVGRADLSAVLGLRLHRANVSIRP